MSGFIFQADPIRQLFSLFCNRLISYAGIAIALLILLVWAISFITAFSLGAEAVGLFGSILLIPWFTFLYTGLFVIGHDAMHGSVAPEHPKINRALGELSLLLYGFIPYDRLRTAHANHHRFPASYYDPDFHNGRYSHPVMWYCRFMCSYWTRQQAASIIVIYNGLYRVMGVSESNLLVFWAIPALLSSVQLFYFGTYLVHRKLSDTYSTPLCANSLYWPNVFSLLACYHFGYHREHHAFPAVPWWRLPQVSLKNTSQFSGQLSALPQSVEKCRYASQGSTLAKISSPLVQRDRTRLKT